MARATRDISQERRISVICVLDLAVLCHGLTIRMSPDTRQVTKLLLVSLRNHRLLGGCSMRARWEHFPHEADMVCAGSVGTKAEAFEQAALALTAVVTDVHSVGGRELIDIRCEVPDDELRLAGWLNSLIYEMPVRKMLFSRFWVQFDGNSLRRAWESPSIPRATLRPWRSRGRTYTSLRVAEQNGERVAQTVVDL